MEHNPYAFFAMTAFSSAIALFVAWAGLHRYNKLSSTLPLSLSDAQSRLAKIRKVGLADTNNTRKSRKPWLSLPLRRRNLDGWS
jgi:magnesium transporter